MIEITHIDDEQKRQLMPLLLDGDEQESMIDRYLARGDVYASFDGGGKPVAVAVVTYEGDGICELKNIAIAAQHRRRGIGRAMVQYLCTRYAGECHTMMVGTGDSRATTEFYRNCGFTYSHIVPEFFTRNYDHPIIEEGKQLRDMVYFKYNLL